MDKEQEFIDNFLRTLKIGDCSDNTLYQAEARAVALHCAKRLYAQAVALDALKQRIQETEKKLNRLNKIAVKEF